MELLKRHVVRRARTYAHTHTRPHMLPGFWKASQKDRNLLPARCGEPQVLCLTFYTSKSRGPNEGKTHRYGSRPCGAVWAAVRTAPSKMFPSAFFFFCCCFFVPQFVFDVCLTDFWILKIARRWSSHLGCFAEQVHFNWIGFCCRHRFLSHPFSRHLLPCLISSGEESSADCSSCLFMSSVSVARNPHNAQSADWKTIQFSLARLAIALWSGSVLCSRPVWCECHHIMAHSYVPKIHPAEANEALMQWPVVTVAAVCLEKWNLM